MNGFLDGLKVYWKSYRYSVLLLIVMELLFVLWGTNIPFIYPKESSAWLWLESAFLVVAIFTFKRWFAALSLWSLVTAALIASDRMKAELLEFPLIEQDLTMAAKNPFEVLDSAGASKVQQFIIAAVLISGLVFIVYRLFRKHSQKHGLRRFLLKLAIVATIAFVSLNIFVSFYKAYGKYIYKNIDSVVNSKELWQKYEVMNASRRLTVLGFLSYSNRAVKDSRDLLKALRKGKPSVEPERIEASAANLYPHQPDGAKLPNIVFVLAESTFDPNRAFYLSHDVGGELYGSRLEQSGGLLHEPEVGGGTWKTEFATITGLDTRLFGYLGDYTHCALAPYIKKTFVTYLNEKGYRSEVFYPLSGNFFCSKTAYPLYGFSKYYEGKDLGMEEDRTKFSDEAMSEQIVQRIDDAPGAPFFYYVLYLENHYPHPCKNFGDSSQFAAEFSHEEDFQHNCELNEYMLRERSTERGLMKIINRLKEVETRTGRPYILVVFGDHQPSSFVKSEFDKHRRALSKNYTLYKMFKSDSVVMPALSNSAMNVTLLPTLVSAAVAQNPKDIYMPENLYLHEECGAVDDIKKCQALNVIANAYVGYIKY